MIELLVDALATFRLTRLVTRDKVGGLIRSPVIAMSYSAAGTTFTAQEIKDWTIEQWDDLVLNDDSPPTWAAFVVCPWCVGVWAAFGVVILRRTCPGFWTPVARALAFSAAAGLLAKV